MKLFIDANILVSVLNKEYPSFSFTSRIISLADHKQFQLFTSPICLAIAFYFSEKKSGYAIAKKKIGLLADKMSIAVHEKNDIQLAVNNNKIHDLEDGLEYYAAVHAGCSCIVTEDSNDFYFSSIQVLCAEDFLLQHVIKNKS